MESSSPADVPTTGSDEAAPGANAPAFRWRREVDLRYNREMLSYYAPYAVASVVFAVGAALFLALLAPSIGTPIALATVLLTVLIVGIVWGAMWLRHVFAGPLPPAEFEVGPAGIRRANGKVEFGRTGSALDRSPGQEKSPEGPGIGEVVGATVDVLSALTADTMYVSYPRGSASTGVATWAWPELTGVTYDRRRHVIALKGSNSRRLWLYCGSGEWDRVVAWVRWGTPKGVKVRDASGTGGTGGTGAGSAARR